MHKHHKFLLAKLRKNAPKESCVHYGDSYTGSNRPYYSVSVPIRRNIIKDWLRKNKILDSKEILAVVDSLFHGRSHEEKTMAAYLLGYRADVKKIISTKQLDTWLGELVGWAEVDALCQNVFQPEELLVDWNTWKEFLTALSKSKNIHKRRASLVLLVGPTWKSNDVRLHALAYKYIEHLKGEKDILITKAISWLLRAMTATRKKEVASYLKTNEDSLPKIAVRETKKKIKTGKKN